MWISEKLFNLVNANRDEITKLRQERDSVRDELSRANILNDWLRVQINTLQMERQQLLEKAHGIKVPAPILDRVKPMPAENTSTKDFSFEDIGDELAKKLGLPTYN
jgi:hypothetical protein